MVIKSASPSDASIIHQLMIEAYKEYENQTPSSSALKETIQSVREALSGTEQAFIAYDGSKPIGMVRFQNYGTHLYFYRLSVLPAQQGKGIAKCLLQEIEDYATEHNIPVISCKVRKAMPRNVYLYRSLNYEIKEEEILPLPNNQAMEVYIMEKKLSSFQLER